jgi:hypothetical protein
MGTNQSFVGNLETRRAVKHFAEGKVDSSSVLKAMLNAPTSFGLQPYKILVVTDKDIKTKLRSVSYNQAQVTECDTLYILCARKDVEERAEEYLKMTAAEEMRGMLTGFAKGIPDKTAWAARQTYIALGFGLAAAAEENIASCPMEGFSSEGVAKLLSLPDVLVPVVYLAVGRDADEDGTHPRFRFPEADLVKEY